MTTDKKKKREFIGMHFKCCKVYSRIYINAARTAFIGHCPKCAVRVQVNISKTGTKNPFFVSE